MLRRRNGFLQARAESFAVATNPQPHTLFAQFFALLLKVEKKQRHQRFDFSRRSAQILATEGETGQALHVEFLTGRHNIPNTLDAHLMTGHARHTALFCPTVVAIYDDGDMAQSTTCHVTTPERALTSGANQRLTRNAGVKSPSDQTLFH